MGMQMNQMRPGGKPRSQIHELLIEKLKNYGEEAVRLGQHEVWCNVEYLKVAVLDALDAVCLPVPCSRPCRRCHC